MLPSRSTTDTPTPPSKPEPFRAEDWLSIPVTNRSASEVFARELQSRGQFLARQDRWDELAAEMSAADADKQVTSNGTPVTDLLAYGARSDVIQAVEHALAEGAPANSASLIDGVSGLEEVLNEHPGDAMLAAVVALTHVDMGWAWRGTGWDSIVPRLNRERCAAHFDRATDVLAPYARETRSSPFLMAARCALFAGRRIKNLRVADEYERLIDLAPNNHRHMRAMGTQLLPRWFGTYDELELEARRTASRTQGIWGAGGYAWVYFDAIAMDEEACARIDVEFFVDGLRDIIKARPDQEMVNLLAAYCAVALRNGMGLDEGADFVRAQICSNDRWLIRDHMTEIHPLIWAHATDGFDNNARITSPSRFAARGRADALHVIADLFRDEISRGLRVTFTPDGPRVEA
ncbi:hypothetical protein [Tropicibacter sp. Alg240-R139]|uniref:hypothetical protein n=1 Tax=Tropicibacter sp. Alg240-R139 TaxID=2305991 RepID=UPI001F082B91|nr:hypothetical protein [Tropicibacter sp. Alg240-R139]